MIFHRIYVGNIEISNSQLSGTLGSVHLIHRILKIGNFMD